MFRVGAISPLDERWEERDGEITIAAGRKSITSVATCLAGHNPTREHYWLTPTFEEAKAMQQRLVAVDGVIATIRED